jgi:hypothetical protein
VRPVQRGRPRLTALLTGAPLRFAVSEFHFSPVHSAAAGRFRIRHAFLIGQILNKIDVLEETVAACTGEIERLLDPCTPVLERLVTTPVDAARRKSSLARRTGRHARQRHSGPVSVRSAEAETRSQEGCRRQAATTFSRSRSL